VIFRTIDRRIGRIIKSRRHRASYDWSLRTSRRGDDRNCLRISVVDLLRKLRMNRVVLPVDATRRVLFSLPEVAPQMCEIAVDSTGNW